MITGSRCVRMFSAAAGMLLAAVIARGGTLVVTNTNDNLAGSLRQAIQDANPGDTIVFAIPTTNPNYNPLTGLTTVTLTTASAEDVESALVISKDLTIDGASKIVIARSSAKNTPNFRVFSITAGTVTLRNLTVSSGYLPNSGGAGIRNESHLSVRGCAVINNNAQEGAGIFNLPAGALEVINSTFYGNVANGTIVGRAIDNRGTARLISSTVSANPATSDDFAVYNSGTMNVGNTIIAGNPVGASGFVDTGGQFVSEGFNFIGDPTANSGFGASSSHDQVGTDAQPADPKLYPIEVITGSTAAFRPMPGSTVIDQGNSFADGNGNPVTVDERGQPRPVDQPGINNAGDGSDIGAVEVGLPQPGPTFRVTSIANHDDGVCSSDDCTLRDALKAANANADANTIVFAPGVTGYIINTTAPSGFTLTNTVTINGPGAQLLTLSGNGSSRIFNVASGVTATISGLTLTGADTTRSGMSDNSGGAVENFGTLTLDRCELDANSGGSGGAVANLATLTITNCAFVGNFSTGNGGALRNVGNMTVTNSTITGNNSVNSGAISSFVNDSAAPPATATVTNCTVTYNKATDANGTGGGLNNGVNSTMTVRNTIVASNTTPNGNNGPDVYGSFTSGGHNLIRFSGGNPSFVNKVNGDQVGGASASDPPKDPKLGVFGYHGGPTETLTLLSDSSAINAGNNANAPATDQRGYYRNGISDIGAFEFNGIAPVKPSVTTDAATNVTTTTATLHATVNPNGLATSVLFTTDFGSFAAKNIGSGTGAVSVSQNVTGLSPGTTYHFNATATNSAGSTHGVQQAFTTLPAATPGPTPTPTPTATPTPPSQLLNLSTRKQVGAGNNVLIGGFIVVGTENKKVLLRGLGPSLPVSGALADPTLELHRADTTLLAANNNWRDKQEAEIIATGIPPSKNLESAIVATLAAKPLSAGGAGYTGVLAGTGGTTGIGLLEIYDLNTAAKSKLANISTRGFVGTGDDLLIGGFIPGPSNRLPIKVLVRALGPSLAGQGVSGVLSDPLLELHDANGTLLSNDNWKDASNAAEIQATLPPPKDRESAIITTLAPSNAGYTAVVRGANGSTGVALVEVYALQ